jgi:hypothetical protein
MPAPSAPALVAGVQEAAGTAAASAPALVEEYLVEECGAAGTPAAPSAPTVGQGYGLTVLAAGVGFLLGKHNADKHHAHRRRREDRDVVDVDVDVEVEEDDDDDRDERRRREYGDDDDYDARRRRSGER